MKNCHFLFISFLVLCGLELSAQTLCSYNYRKRITIDPASVTVLTRGEEGSRLVRLNEPVPPAVGGAA